MKKIGLIAAALLTISQTAFAMLPLTERNISAAQKYGVERKSVPLGEVIAPWTIYDRKQTNKYGLRERVVVYTPYLTAAVDAQQKATQGGKATVAQGVAVAKQYNGVLALGVTLSTSVKLDPKNLTVKMYQGNKVVEPYYKSLNTANQRDMQVLNQTTGALQTANVWDIQYYVYFDLRKLNPNRTMVLAAIDEYGGTREFVINLSKLN